MFGFLKKKIAKVEFDAGSVVRRARAGDQNAMALIAAAREEAHKGNQKAKAALAAIVDYAKRYPPGTFPRPSVSFGAEGIDALQALSRVVPKREETIADRTFTLDPTFLGILLIVPQNGGVEGFFGAAEILADGPSLTKDKVENAGTIIPEGPARDMFFRGVDLGASQEGTKTAMDVSPPYRPFLNAGRLIGHARGIQAVRAKQPISILDKVAGWELGEGTD